MSDPLGDSERAEILKKAHEKVAYCGKTFVVPLWAKAVIAMQAELEAAKFATCPSCAMSWSEGAPPMPDDQVRELDSADTVTDAEVEAGARASYESLKQWSDNFKKSRDENDFLADWEHIQHDSIRERYRAEARIILEAVAKVKRVGKNEPE